MSIAIIFPGQGSQKVGMGAEVSQNFAGTAPLWAQANEILGYDLQKLCFEGPDDELKNTLYAQPALLTVGVLHFQAAQSNGLTADMTAGHSLGEYAALVAAGALDFEAALRLVKRRAELMSQAPEGAMAAIIGLADEKLDAVLAEASTQGPIVAANFNSPGQVVVSGAPEAIAATLTLAKANGAKMAVKLAVSGAFHSPLMQSAGEEMAALIEAAPFRNTQIPVFQNTSAVGATQASDLKAALIPQMTGAVHWTQSVQNMIAAGADQFIELGPGNVLSGLIKRIDKSVTTENR